MARIARRLLPVIERDLGLCVYPDQKTCWHYDDKIAQRYLLEALGLPIPNTWVWFKREAAIEWAETADYPLVVKLSTGAASSNVQLIAGPREARRWIDMMFSRWSTSLASDAAPLAGKERLLGAAHILATGHLPDHFRGDREPQRGYILFQEFVPGNDFDTRITVIGNRAFGYRRLNREGDFRASGGGRVVYAHDEIDPETVRLAFRTAQALRSQSIGVDCLKRGDDCVIGEVSYTYISWLVHDCPGHWELAGTPSDGELVWRAGSMWPEEAQVADYLQRLESCASNG